MDLLLRGRVLGGWHAAASEELGPGVVLEQLGAAAGPGLSRGRRGAERVQPPGTRRRSRAVSKGDPSMAAVSDLVSAVVNKPVAAAARLARRALERIAPEAEGKAEAAPRKSKGWRKHVRRVKASQQGARR